MGLAGAYAVHHDLLSYLRTRVEPRVTRLRPALLTPTVVSQEDITISGALYDPTGSIVLDSIFPGGGLRQTDPVCLTQRAWQARAALNLQSGIYGGIFYYAWGHFLIETLSTAHETDFDPLIPLVFSPYPTQQRTVGREAFLAM